MLALFWYGSMSPLQLPGAIVTAGLETGIVLLLLGDSAILAKALERARFGDDVEDFLTGISDNKYVFLLVVNLLLLAVGIFIEPLPALCILAPFLAPVAVLGYGIDPVHFGLIMVFNLVLALIHPPIGLVLFLVSSIAKVSVERLSIMILPWLAVSLLVLFLVTYLPSEAVLCALEPARVRRARPAPGAPVGGSFAPVTPPRPPAARDPGPVGGTGGSEMVTGWPSTASRAWRWWSTPATTATSTACASVPTSTFAPTCWRGSPMSAAGAMPATPSAVWRAWRPTAARPGSGSATATWPPTSTAPCAWPRGPAWPR